jgi:hypothetical protein
MTNPNSSADIKKRNLRTGLILASIALVFFLGVIAKYVFFVKL